VTDRSRIAALPKAELHLHIEGTLEPELAFELARRNGVGLPFDTVEELSAAYDFSDLGSFLDLYYQCSAVLVTARDFEDLGRAYFERAAADGVRHVELFFDPQTHLVRGVAFDDVVDGLVAACAWAKEAHDISSGLIMCFLRDRPVEEAHEVLSLALARSGDLIGVGLDSYEAPYPPSLFTEVYARARAAGLRAVAHAGEEGPAGFVSASLDLLGVERIDHGIRSVEDPALLTRLASQRTALTVCPLSNVKLRVVDAVGELPLRTFMDVGVVFTLNSDDPAYFGGYVGDNYVAAQAAFSFSEEELAVIARDSFRSSFIDAGRRDTLLAEVEAWLKGDCPA
jgi:adenosine deaminase